MAAADGRAGGEVDGTPVRDKVAIQQQHDARQCKRET